MAAMDTPLMCLKRFLRRQTFVEGHKKKMGHKTCGILSGVTKCVSVFAICCPFLPRILPVPSGVAIGVSSACTEVIECHNL